MNTKVLIIGFVALIGLLLVGSKIMGGDTTAGVITSDSYRAATRGVVQGAAPDFTAPHLGGETITLSDYEGEKAVVLDFFATWCPNCRRDMPKLSKMYEKYKDDVEVIGVNLREDEGKVADFISSRDISFPIVFDPSSQIARSYGVQYTNHHVLINKEGSIVGIVPGDISEAQVKSLIE